MESVDGQTKDMETQEKDDLLVVFSDLDGTLIHYAEEPPASEAGNRILKLPPSSTGMRGIISSKSLSMVQDVRRRNVKFVLVSGMR
jgi:hydroxymethylpyrimidine pyrophosphatase-like HAD family hydrolase